MMMAGGVARVCGVLLLVIGTHLGCRRAFPLRGCLLEVAGLAAVVIDR